MSQRGRVILHAVTNYAKILEFQQNYTVEYTG